MNLSADEIFSPANRKQPTARMSPNEIRELEAIAARGNEIDDEENDE